MITVVLLDSTDRVLNVYEVNVDSFDDYITDEKVVEFRPDFMTMPDVGWLWNGVNFIEDGEEPDIVSTKFTRVEWIMRWSPAEWSFLNHCRQGTFAGVLDSIQNEIGQLMDVILFVDDVDIDGPIVARLHEILETENLISGSRVGELRKARVIKPATNRRTDGRPQPQVGQDNRERPERGGPSGGRGRP